MCVQSYLHILLHISPFFNSFFMSNPCFLTNRIEQIKLEKLSLQQLFKHEASSPNIYFALLWCLSSILLFSSGTLSLSHRRCWLRLSLGIQHVAEIKFNSGKEWTQHFYFHSFTLFFLLQLLRIFMGWIKMFVWISIIMETHHRHIS